MKIKLTNVFVQDQAQALRFYTEVLGFVLKNDIPLGDARWLTVVSPDEPDGTELLLEPEGNPALAGATQAFKRALYEAGIPYAAFFCEDLRAEVERLKGLGVAFVVEPTPTVGATIAVLDDTCGNLIQLVEPGSETTEGHDLEGR